MGAGLRQYERTVQLHPDFATTLLVLAWGYLELGRFDDGGEVLARWARVTGHDQESVRAVARRVAQYARTGEPQLLTELDPEAVFPPFSLVGLHVLLSQYELALDVLERGYEGGAFGVVTALFGAPVGTWLKAHPRYIALVEKVG